MKIETWEKAHLRKECIFAGGVKSWYLYDIKKTSNRKSCSFLGPDWKTKKKNYKKNGWGGDNHRKETRSILPHDTESNSIQLNRTVYWMSKINYGWWRDIECEVETQTVWLNMQKSTRWMTLSMLTWNETNKRMKRKPPYIQSQICVDVRGGFKHQQQHSWPNKI